MVGVGRDWARRGWSVVGLGCDLTIQGILCHKQSVATCRLQQEFQIQESSEPSGGFARTHGPLGGADVGDPSSEVGAARGGVVDLMSCEKHPLLWAACEACDNMYMWGY